MDKNLGKWIIAMGAVITVGGVTIGMACLENEKKQEVAKEIEVSESPNVEENKLKVKLEPGERKVEETTNKNESGQGSVNIVQLALKLEEQETIKVNQKAMTINGEEIPISGSVQLADDQAASSVAQLYAYLEAVGKSDSVLYGHQNDIHHKAGSKRLTNSDTKDVTGSIAAVVGIDTLSLTGNETMYSNKADHEKSVANSVRITKEAAGEGAIITLSAHMPNFVAIAEREENQKGANGTLDWKKANFLSKGNNSDGSWVTTGDVVSKIMPGGELNYLFNAYLDMIAAYATQVGDEIPVMFRPFHENTGSWFWWGKDLCDEEAYKNLYRYTVEYLRDKKGVHNFLYVYGPSSEATSVAEYEVRYPGDEYVDMVGFDMYHQYPKVKDDFISQFKAELQVVGDFAKAHNKLFAVTETGIANGNKVLLEADNERMDWYNEIAEAVSPTDASYFLLWANFSTNQHYTPYVLNKEGGILTGHEMLEGFVSFYNNPKSIFANQQGNFSDLKVSIKESKAVSD